MSGITDNNVEEDDFDEVRITSINDNRMHKLAVEGKNYLVKANILPVEKPKDFDRGARPIDSIDIR